MPEKWPLPPLPALLAPVAITSEAKGGNADVAPRRDIGVAAVSADPRQLNGGLIDTHIVRLVGQGDGTISRLHPDIDRLVHIMEA